MKIKVYLKIQKLASDGVEETKLECVGTYDSKRYYSTMSTAGVLKIHDRNCRTPSELEAAYGTDSWSFMVKE